MGSDDAGGGGTGQSILGTFTAISGDVANPTTVYMNDGGGAGGAVPNRYPTSPRTVAILRLSAPVGTGASPPTATLWKNGVATAMTCTLGAGAAAGANVADSAHPISFAAGDTFDVVLTQPIAAEGAAPFTATLEGPAGGSSLFVGFGAGVAGPTAVGSGGSSATARRSDQTAAAYRSDLPLSATWFIDTVNGSDGPTNGGTTAATALLTWGELRRRWWGAEITQDTTVTVMGDANAADVGAWHFKIREGFTVTFQGSLGAVTGFGGAAIDNTVHSGTVTAFTAATAGPAADDTEMTDGGLAVSFTASGMLAAGVLFKRTNSTALYWFGLKDLGAKTLRITPPMLNSGVLLSAALAVNDTYDAYQLWKVYDQDFGAEARRVIYLNLDDEGANNQFTHPGLAVRRQRIWMGSNRAGVLLGNQQLNVMFASSAATCLVQPTNVLPTQIIGGGARGDGTQNLTFFGVMGFGGTFVSQGVQIGTNDAAYMSVEGGLAIHDCTVPMMQATGGSRIAFPNSGGLLSGKGNSGKIFNIVHMSGVSWSDTTVKPPFVTGSTSDGSPITIGGVSYAVAVLPANADLLLTPGQAWPMAQSAGLQAFALVCPVSQEIDFAAAPATYTIVSPVGLKVPAGVATIIAITAKDGTVTVAPTLQLGTNAGINDIAASQTPGGFVSQAAGTRLSLTSPSPINSLDLTTNGIRLQITAAATLGTATQLKGRVLFSPGLGLASY